MRILFILLSLVYLNFAWAAEGSEAVQLSRTRKLSQDSQWLRIIHFKTTMFGKFESQIDSANFFISPEGKTNSQAELEATLLSFFEQPASIAEQDSVQCRFPARYLFLKKQLGDQIKNWPDRPCPKFQKWFEALHGNSVSMVFSSYFLNNPASTFGHTFLRINKAPSSRDGQRYELLDYGVNFAANATTSNPLLYTINGLFGGFPGTFTTVPYYYKVREYNNSESRDLWEYELSLDPAEVDFLVAHIWEVGPAYADYWYLTENCSYFIFTLLEAASPNVDLTSKLKKFVIPTDTVQLAWQQPGLIRSVHFRPSVRAELYHRLLALNEDEKNIVAQTIETQAIGPEIKSLNEHRRLLVLDAAIDNMDYQYAVSIQIQKSPEAQFKAQLLAARSEISEISERLSIEAPAYDAPHLGHGSRRVGVGFLDSRQQGSAGLFSYKFALHDLLDPVIGYPEYAQISFFDLKFSYFDKNRVTGNRNQLELENLMLFEVISLSPYTQFSKSISWRLHVGVERMLNEDCFGCHAGQLSGGAGYTLRLSESPLVVGYLGLKAGLYFTTHGGETPAASTSSFPRLLAGAGPNLTLRARWNERWISLLEGWVRKDQNVTYSEYKEISLSTQWSPDKTWGLKVTGVDRWFEKSGSLEYLYYY